jgi:hypothetical protein
MRDLEDFLTTTLAVRRRPKKPPTTATQCHGRTCARSTVATTPWPEGPLAGGGLMGVKQGQLQPEGGSCR